MRLPTLAAAVLLALPMLAQAADPAHCKFSEPRSLKLDLAGATSVLFKVGSSDLRLKAGNGAAGALNGRACASSADLLKDMQISQQRDGDKLVVTLMPEKKLTFSFSGSTYWYMDLDGTVPNDVLVQLDVGSGDASLTGAKAASADVGSGDIDLRDIAGPVTAKIGSGDLKLDGAASLKLLSIGSGDAEVNRVAGKADIGSVGSGDLKLQRVGSVSVGSVGSGDVELRDVGGDVTVGSIGSGDLNVNDVRGNLTVRSRGSGDIDQHGVTGTVDVPKDH
ncbi:DUF4097 family beta strand repeat-containing protein [Pseudoxanthomonas sp. GM95]|uniref:DUF4097 family beta strand repeat-containing protein n=1 Tax=Pseudoxanthomonas sp. GM95 TaxID=1881043 RepID=UPI000B8933F4|nr:DUF4097 family beta strand repeat-containing protein [Pseudoxanthomonas sp. GM95]